MMIREPTAVADFAVQTEDEPSMAQVQKDMKNLQV